MAEYDQHSDRERQLREFLRRPAAHIFDGQRLPESPSVEPTDNAPAPTPAGWHAAPLPSSLTRLRELADHWARVVTDRESSQAAELRVSQRLGYRIPMADLQQHLLGNQAAQWERDRHNGQFNDLWSERVGAVVRHRFELDSSQVFDQLVAAVRSLDLEALDLEYALIGELVSTERAPLPTTAAQASSQEVAKLRHQVTETLKALRDNNAAEPTLPEVADYLKLTRRVLRYRLEHWTGAIDPNWHWAPADAILSRIREGRVNTRWRSVRKATR
jgi:hypothetical protein